MISRTQLTGYLDLQTPICVIQEIADAHGVDIDGNKLRDDHYRYWLLDTLHKPIKINTYEEMARYINHQVEWPLKALTQAYNHLRGFEHITASTAKLIKYDNVGPQTPANITNLNCCIIYRLCRELKINTTKSSTLAEMVDALELIKQPVDILQGLVCASIDQLEPCQLANILKHIKLEPSGELTQLAKVDLDFDRLKLLTASTQDIKQLQIQTTPTTPEGAVILGGQLYHLDLSRAKYPHREFVRLKIQGLTNYVPEDPWYRHWYQKNSSLFDLHHSFNPYLPMICYSEKMLQNLARGFGSCSGFPQENWNDLSMHYFENHFYQGDRPNTQYETPIDLLECETLDPISWVCFGNNEQGFRAITFDELYHLFNTTKQFTNPFEANAVFTDKQITRLSYILQKTDTTSQLEALIAQIKMLQTNLNKSDIILREDYLNASPEDQREVVRILFLILYAGMHMRGWETAYTDYPVHESIVNPQHIDRLEQLVHKDLLELKELGKDPWVKRIINLKVVTCGYRSPNMTERAQGLTIKEKVDVILANQDVNACIRMASNWFCATAHKYLTLLGKDPKFDINNLTKIL